MHDLATIKARNARAMKDADKTDRSARHMLPPTSMEGDTEHKPTALQIAARDALMGLVLSYPEACLPSDVRAAVDAYRKAYNM